MHRHNKSRVPISTTINATTTNIMTTMGCDHDNKQRKHCKGDHADNICVHALHAPRNHHTRPCTKHSFKFRNRKDWQTCKNKHGSLNNPFTDTMEVYIFPTTITQIVIHEVGQPRFIVRSLNKRHFHRIARRQVLNKSHCTRSFSDKTKLSL